MKTLHYSIILLVIVLSSQLAYATTYGGHLGPMTVQMPFMKTNSIGTITIKYVIYYPHNDTFDTAFVAYDDKLQNSKPLTLNDLTINAEPKSINLLENNTVTYTIVAKNNVKGVYGIAPIFPCGRYPLVVGLNESEIMPSTLFRLSMPIHCGAIPSNAPVREIMHYDGIILKNVTRTQDQFSPIEQIQLGSNSTDVQCKQGLDLIIKTHDNMPACVKSDTVQKLIERGWSKLIFEAGIAINSYTPIQNDTKIESMVSNDTTYMSQTVDEWKRKTPEQLDAYYKKYKDAFYDELGSFLIKDEMKKELERQDIKNIHDNFKVFPGMSLDSLPPHVSYDAVVNATDGNSYLLLGSVFANKIESLKITKLAFDKDVLNSLDSGKILPYTGQFAVDPKTAIQDSNIPWSSIGTGKYGVLEISLYASVYHMIPDAQKYYTARVHQLIPFYVPVTITTPTFATDGVR